MLTTLGLAIVCIAWFYQFCLIAYKKDKIINNMFVGVYAVGVLFLVIDGFMSGVNSITWLNLISLVISVGVLVALMKK
jgi:hypothetical protein